MKTIVPAKTSIADIWGHPKPKETVYRLMKYLLKIPVEERILLHNVVTGHLVLLNEEEVEAINGLPSAYSDALVELIAEHFVVPEAFDEYKSVAQLRAIMKTRPLDDAKRTFVILPTTFCNAHCFYCYECNFQHIHMTEETAHKLVNYIVRESKGKSISLKWFGGEPLVGVKRIDQISEELTSYGVQYQASMISNGYLFDEEIVHRAKELWKLGRVQITLDGTEEVYNKTKAYSNASSSPYKRVLDNIKLLEKNEIFVEIRLNMEFYNINDLSRLVEELSSYFAGSKYVTAYVAVLYNDEGYDPVHRSDDDFAELLCRADDLTKRIEELRLGKKEMEIPFIKANQCMADNPQNVLIQPDGSFCKCEHYDSSDSYGSLDDGITNKAEIDKWNENVERSKKCPECPMFPFCYVLKSCENAKIKCSSFIQERFTNEYTEYLRNVYFRKRGEMNNEAI